MSQRWQHKVVEINRKVFRDKTAELAQAELDKMSTQGWELVAVTQASPVDTIRMYFKREA